MIEIRKLAAIDLAFLGSKIIIPEFLLGVIGPAALGIFIALRSHTPTQQLLAAYFLSLSLNYVPLLFYAIRIGRSGTARQEIEDDLAYGKSAAMRKYRRGSLLLLVPFLVPVLAFAQSRRGQDHS